MKKLSFLLLVGLVASLLVSCYLPGSKLKPGDKIGNMEFITEYESCPAPHLAEICSGATLEDGTCKIPASITKFWVGASWVEDTTEEVEEAWRDSEWKMTFDGKPVDLPAFRTFDMDFKDQKARVWDVCVSNPAPGEHIVHFDFYMPNGVQHGNHAIDYVFTVLPPEQAQDSSLPAAEGTPMIEPGDFIGDFQVTKGEGENITYIWQLDSECIDQRDAAHTTCTIAPDTEMNVSWGVYDDTLSGKLDEYWTNHTHEMYINGRPVNLESFGSIDVTHPQFGPMRHWNVVITSKSRGDITVYSKGIVGGEPFEGSTTYSFNAP